jgi:hypothetical protein
LNNFHLDCVRNQTRLRAPLAFENKGLHVFTTMFMGPVDRHRRATPAGI